MQQIQFDPPLTREDIIPHIYPRLLSAEYQAQRLESVVKKHISADLWLTWVAELGEIIPSEKIPVNSHPIAPITYDFADNFKLSIQDLLHIGYENSHGKYTCQKLGDVLSALCDSSLPVPEDTPSAMYVLTTRSGAFGAAAILDPDIQHKLRNIFGGNKFFCCPSSRHEFLVVPANGDENQKYELASMVHTINRDASTIDPKDVLSDHIFVIENDTLAVVV